MLPSTSTTLYFSTQLITVVRRCDNYKVLLQWQDNDGDNFIKSASNERMGYVFQFDLISEIKIEFDAVRWTHHHSFFCLTLFSLSSLSFVVAFDVVSISLPMRKHKCNFHSFFFCCETGKVQVIHLRGLFFFLLYLHAFCMCELWNKKFNSKYTR